MGRKGSGCAGEETKEEEGRHGRPGESPELPRAAQQMRHHSAVTGRPAAGFPPKRFTPRDLLQSVALAGPPVPPRAEALGGLRVSLRLQAEGGLHQPVSLQACGESWYVHPPILHSSHFTKNQYGLLLPSLIRLYPLDVPNGAGLSGPLSSVLLRCLHVGCITDPHRLARIIGASGFLMNTNRLYCSSYKPPPPLKVFTSWTSKVATSFPYGVFYSSLSALQCSLLSWYHVTASSIHSTACWFNSAI